MDSCSGFEERAFRHSSENHRKIYRHFWYNIGNRKVGGLNEKKQDIVANEEMPISEEMVVSYVSALRKIILKKTGKKLEDCD